MGSAFLEITVIVCLAAILSFLFRLLKQPAILAYILTGILIGFLGFFDVSNHDLLNTSAQLGITFLLFTLGLEIKIKNFASISRVVFVVAAVQMLFSFLAGYIASLLFGFTVTSAIYIGIALMFSSTVIVVKFISERKEFHSLYGKIAVGILLIQDLLAIGILVFLSAFNPEFLTVGRIFVFSQIVIKGSLLFGAVFFLQKYVFPKITEKLAQSTETLFLASIAWVFGLSALVSSIGFSVEIGGFLAGIALANSFVNYQIIARSKILQDFFIVLFFVLLGTQMVVAASFGGFLNIFIPALTFSILTLVVKPFIVMIIMGVMGYKKRTSFLTGTSLSQISEFSLITVFLGQRLRHVSSEVISIITFSAIITFTLSTYLLSGNKDIYKVIHRHLSFLEFVPIKKEEEIESKDELSDLKNHVVLVGGDQMGQSILDALEDMNVEVVVVDFDPEILKNLEKKKVHRLYGDISDLDIQRRAKLDSAKLVISTNPDLEDNLLLLRELKHENRRAKIVLMAFDSIEAKNLYKAGADYVILPHLAGGRQIAKLISENQLDRIESLKKKDLEYIS